MSFVYSQNAGNAIKVVIIIAFDIDYKVRLT